VGCIDREDSWVSTRNTTGHLRSTDKTSRFKGAYTTVLESEPLHEIFGDMEVVADSLPGMADGIIAAESKA
jgi:hypothetical protein